MQVDDTVSRPPPTAVGLVLERYAAITREFRGGCYFPGGQASQRRDHLEDRPRRIEATDRTIGHGIVGCTLQGGPFALAEWAGQLGRVEGGMRCNRQDVAGLCIHRDQCGAPLLGQNFKCAPLHGEVDGEHRVTACLAWDILDLTDGPGLALDLQLDQSRLPAQPPLQSEFDPGPARTHAGNPQARIALHGLPVRTAGMADDLPHDRSMKVAPLIPSLSLQTRQFRRQKIDSRNLLPTEASSDQDRHARVLPNGEQQDAVGILVGDWHDPIEAHEDLGDIASQIRHHGKPLNGLVVRQDDAEPVEDTATFGGRPVGRHSIAFGEHLIAARVADLQRVQPVRQDAD